jgi:hypothetical protein
LRWGIVDVESWLSTLDPRIVDAWIRFANIEPEHFQAGGMAAGQQSGSNLMDGRDAARSLAARIGR